jgi:hypothetical protein
MTKNTKALAAFALAASSSALSTAVMLNFALTRLDASVSQLDDGISVAVLDEMLDIEEGELQHEALHLIPPMEVLRMKK